MRVYGLSSHNSMPGFRGRKLKSWGKGLQREDKQEALPEETSELNGG